MHNHNLLEGSHALSAGALALGSRGVCRKGERSKKIPVKALPAKWAVSTSPDASGTPREQASDVRATALRPQCQHKPKQPANTLQLRTCRAELSGASNGCLGRQKRQHAMQQTTALQAKLPTCSGVAGSCTSVGRVVAASRNLVVLPTRACTGFGCC